MRTRPIERDRADDRLDQLAREGVSWSEHVAALREAGRRGWATRQRRERREPDPPRVLKRSPYPAHLFALADGLIALMTTYRPALVAEIQERYEDRWWCTSLRAWLIGRPHARDAYDLLARYYQHVIVDVALAGELGWLVLPPDGGPEVREAA